jgi:hypothetical protein
LSGNVNPNSYLLVPVTQEQPTLNYTYAAGVLTLTWNGSGFHLQAQTNTLSAGLSGVWSDYPNGGNSPVNVPVDGANGAVFFRLSN